MYISLENTGIMNVTKYMLSVLLLLNVMQLLAQAPYTGGSGDGYASARLNHVQVSIEAIKFSTYSIYPQPARKGETVVVEFSQQLASSGSLKLFSIQGKLVRKILLEVGTKERKIPTFELNPGVYLLWIQTGEEYLGKKMVVLE